jgi:hypothetical protein
LWSFSPEVSPALNSAIVQPGIFSCSLDPSSYTEKEYRKPFISIPALNKSIKNLDWFEVVETRGRIENGEIGHFQVTLKVGFKIEES